MKNIEIKGSHGVFFVPTINFNVESGVCEISGESYLEETLEFYEPLLQWIKEYTKQDNRPITFNFKLTYFNTSSSRCILDILYVLKEYQSRGGKVFVNWYYDGQDSDIEEEVEDLILETELNINLVPYEND